MSINISFGGANIQRPGAYSTVDTTSMTPVSAGGFKTLAVVGVPNAVNNVYATAEAIQNTVTGTVGTAGNASVVVTAAGMAGSPITVPVAVLSSDTASAVAAKIVTALQANPTINGFFTIANAGAVLTLTAKTIAVNDVSMQVSVANGTCTGLTTTLSAITTQGVLGGVCYFNDPISAKNAIGVCTALDQMNIAWGHGANLVAFSPVAQTALDADWQTAVDLLQREAVDGILVASNTAAINAKVQAHCDAMSTVLNKKERRGFIGHAAGIAGTIASITALQVFNDELATMATPGVYYMDANGNKVLRGSEYLAAAYAGLWASAPAQSPITYDYVNFPGIEKAFLGTEIITLLGAGVAPLEVVPNKGYRIVQGITTACSGDLTKNELSVSTEKMQMNKAIRDFMEAKYVGQAGVAGIEVTMYNDLVSLLEGFVKQGLITSYVKTTVGIVKNGTSFISQWEGKPTLPINNFLLTSHYTL